MRSRMTGQRVVVPAAAGGMAVACFPVRFGSSAQYTGPDSIGGYFIALKFALAAAYPPPVICSPRFFQTDP